MKTKNLVQASANIITITELVVGDVYKRLAKADYQETYKLYMGVVTGVMHNGEDAAITAIEFEESYSSVSVKLQVFSGGTEMQIYAAQPDEITAHMQTLSELAQREVDNKQRELAKSEDALNRIDEVINMARRGELSTASTTTKAIQ